MLNHPRLTNSDIKEFIDTVVRGGADDHAVRRFLDAKQLDESKHTNAALERAVTALIDDCGTLRNSDLESVEARHCGPVFTAIEDHFGDAELGDVQFWSYLAVRHFWRFVSYRQEETWLKARGEATGTGQSEPDNAPLERYLIGKDHYHLPLRMYLRAQAVRDGGSFELADIHGGSTDFWRSQVLAVRTALFPPLARTVARLQNNAKLNIEQQRPAGRRVNRKRANIDFVLHDDSEAAEVIEELWVVTEQDRQSADVKRQEKKAAKKAGTTSKAALKRLAPTPKAAPVKKAAATKAAPTKRRASN
jgi:hypothetical protein